ncbi:hypothetical protein HJC23_000793 [Cyclotella cryptica]|uniref:EF-hand domain-containing protein n=1 Tax=Cyclotella cryptica TaxID=29204 RepID=A0ABD3Q1A1_9STRA
MFANGGDNVNAEKFGLQDDLNAMEENYCSIELGISNIAEENDKLLSTAIFNIQRTLLNHRPLYLQISKNEFAALLLKALGPTKISPSVVDDLFEEIDFDKDGWLSADELAKHLIVVDQKNRMDRYRFFFERLSHPSILGSFSFLCASSLSIAKNVFIRVHGEQELTAFVAELVVWLSLIGSFMFVWGSLRSAITQLRLTQSETIAAKIIFLLGNFTTVGQVINMMWVGGSVAYVSEQWFIGGLCYFIGGLLAFPSIYISTLAELVQNQELVCKLRASFSLGDQRQTNEENATEIVDDISNGSDVSEATSVEDMVEGVKRFSRETMHKRLRSDSNVNIVRELLARDAPLAVHRRAPTCPAAIFDLFETKRLSLNTCETKSLTDSECTNDHLSTWSSLVGKDILLEGNLKNKIEFDFYDALISFGMDESTNLNASFRVMTRLSGCSTTDMTSMRQLATDVTKKDLRRLAFHQLVHLPSMYIAIAYMIGGLMFTVGECQWGFSASTIQNIYLTGSSLYFCGSTGILFRAWMNVSCEWNQLQDSRVALHTMAFSQGTDAEYEDELLARSHVLTRN